MVSIRISTLTMRYVVMVGCRPVNVSVVNEISRRRSILMISGMDIVVTFKVLVVVPVMMIIISRTIVTSISVASVTIVLVIIIPPVTGVVVSIRVHGQ